MSCRFVKCWVIFTCMSSKAEHLNAHIHWIPVLVSMHCADWLLQILLLLCVMLLKGSIAQSGLCWVLHQQRMNDEGLQTLWQGHIWLLAHTKWSAALQARVYCLIHAVPIWSSRGEWCPAPCMTLPFSIIITFIFVMLTMKITTANIKNVFQCFIVKWSTSANIFKF